MRTEERHRNTGRKGSNKVMERVKIRQVEGKTRKKVRKNEK